MKIIIIFLIFFISIIACNDQNKTLEENKNLSNNKDTLQIMDSINYTKDSTSIINEAINISTQKIFAKNIEIDSFFVAYSKVPKDSMRTITTKLKYGKLISNSQKHLSIDTYSTNSDGNSNYYIFQVKKNELMLIFKFINDSWENENYQIFNKDVNGDNYSDIIFHRSTLVGNLYQVHLYIPKTNTFSEAYNFRNAHFDSKNKTIIGLNCDRYQKPELYKYKWNGVKIDTIENIYHYKNNDNKYMKTKKSHHKNELKNTNNQIIINTLPQEYLEIENIDCFLEWSNRYR